MMISNMGVGMCIRDSFVTRFVSISLLIGSVSVTPSVLA
jgi:hypothetical protein